MIRWDEKHLKELVRKMGLERSHGYEQSPIHLSLYGPSWSSEPLLTKIMRLDANEWAALDHTETDRVSVTRYLGSLGCRADGALSRAAFYQQPLPLELTKLLIDTGAFNEYALSTAAKFQRPLTLELAKSLIDAGARDREALSRAAECQRPLPFELAKLLVDAGAFDKKALSTAARYQHPLTLDLAKLLVDAGCDPTAQDDGGWDALVFLAIGDHPADPQVTDLFLSAGCRTDLDGCKHISDGYRLRFDQILKEHAQWKAERLNRECATADVFYGPDWDR